MWRDGQKQWFIDGNQYTENEFREYCNLKLLEEAIEKELRK